MTAADMTWPQDGQPRAHTSADTAHRVPKSADLDLVGIWDVTVGTEKRYELMLDPQHIFVHCREDESVVVWGTWELHQQSGGPAVSLCQHGAHPAHFHNPAAPWAPTWLVHGTDHGNTLRLNQDTVLHRRSGDPYAVAGRMSALMRRVPFHTDAEPHSAGPGITEDCGLAGEAAPAAEAPAGPKPARAHAGFDGSGLIGMWGGDNADGKACVLLFDSAHYLYYHESYQFAHWGRWHLEAHPNANPRVRLGIARRFPAVTAEGDAVAELSLELHALQGDTLWLHDLVMVRDESVTADDAAATIAQSVAWFEHAASAPTLTGDPQPGDSELGVQPDR